MKCLSSTLLTTLLTVAFQAADGAIIFNTDFSGASQAETNGPIAMGGTVASGYAVSTLAKSATATFTIWQYDTSDGNQFSEAPIFAAARTSQLPETLDAAQSVEFSISNNTGTAVAINSIQFNLVRKGVAGDAGTTVWTSLDEYTTPVISFSDNALSGTKSLASSGTLTGDNLLNVAAGGTITLRIALWTPNTANARLGVDDIQVTVVPEVSTVATVLGLMSLVLVGLRRRLRE